MLVVIVALSFMCIFCVQRVDAFVKRIGKISRAQNKLGETRSRSNCFNLFSEAKTSHAKIRFALRLAGRFA